MRKRFVPLVAVLALALMWVIPADASHVTGVTIDPVASFDGPTKSITITGSVSCNEGNLDNVSIDDADVTQTHSPSRVAVAENGTAGPFGPCNDPGNTYEWSITLTSTSGVAFHPGRDADVIVTTSCCVAEFGFEPVTASATVKVLPAQAL